MLANLTFWLIWFFIFIPVLAWILGFVLPTKSKDSPASDQDSSAADSKPTDTSASEVAAVDAPR